MLYVYTIATFISLCRKTSALINRKLIFSHPDAIIQIRKMKQFVDIFRFMENTIWEYLIKTLEVTDR